MDNKLLDLFSEEELESIKREAEQEAQQAIELLKKQEQEKAKELAKKRAREQIKKYYKEQIISTYKAESAQRIEETATKLVNETIKDLQSQIQDLQQKLTETQKALDVSGKQVSKEGELVDSSKIKILEHLGLAEEEARDFVKQVPMDEDYDSVKEAFEENEELVNKLIDQYETVWEIKGNLDFSDNDMSF